MIYILWHKTSRSELRLDGTWNVSFDIYSETADLEGFPITLYDVNCEVGREKIPQGFSYRGSEDLNHSFETNMHIYQSILEWIIEGNHQEIFYEIPKNIFAYGMGGKN